MDESWSKLFQLAEEVTGNKYTPEQKRGILLNNFNRRIHALGLSDVKEYLLYLDKNEEEHAHFISSATIHTTSWFREEPHYVFLEKFLSSHKGIFKMLVTACSTGQEAYSFALVLEQMRRLRSRDFDYQIDAFDIDPVSVAEGQKAIYQTTSLSADMQKKYKPYLLFGSGRATGMFTLDKEIRKRVNFNVGSLTDLSEYKSTHYDWITCRNVLIYFTNEQITNIANQLKSKIKATGRLCFGHSDNIDMDKTGLKLLSNSLYQLKPAEANPHGEVKSGQAFAKQGKLPSKQNQKSALVVDDSQVVRLKLTKILEGAGFIVQSAPDPIEADKLLQKQKFDFLTVDYQMPHKDGVTWVKELHKKFTRTPAVMVSDFTLEDAPQILGILGREVKDFFEKRVLHSHPELLIEKALALTSGQVDEKLKHKSTKTAADIKPVDLILIGASTGGTTAVAELLENFPKPCPPIVIVQHITSQFTKPFAERLAEVSGLNLGEPKDGNVLEPSTVYLSWSDRHIGLQESGAKFQVKMSDAPLMRGHRPSVDFLFKSATSFRTKKMIAVLMTGMGADGAQGLLDLNKKGIPTICQNEESCVVFGMPKEAIKLGAADFIENIEGIRKLLECASGNSNQRDTHNSAKPSEAAEAGQTPKLVTSDSPTLDSKKQAS